MLAKDVPYTAKVEELYRRKTRRATRSATASRSTLKADAPAGTHKHNMYLKTNDPTNPLVPVLIESSVQSLVQVSPSQLDLGAIKTDTPLIRRVVVRGNKPFTIKGVKGTGNGVELGGEIAGPRGDRPLPDVQVPGDEGRRVPPRNQDPARASRTRPSASLIEGTASK